MFAEDRATFIKDFGWPVTVGGQKTLALFDQPDVEILSQRVQATMYTMEYQTETLTGLTHGTTVFVFINGAKTSTKFKCMGTPDMIDNGDFSSVKLEKTA